MSRPSIASRFCKSIAIAAIATIGSWTFSSGALARTTSLSGPFNAVAPRPVTNRDFTRALARQLHRPAFIPTPYFALRLAFGEMASMLVASQRAIPQAAEQAGYQFRYPDISATLSDILSRKNPE